jgi:hypothetical protein
MRRLRRGLAVAVLATLCGFAAGCQAIMPGGLSDRCADFMQRAYPDADIDITKREAAATGINAIVANVAGVRKDMPPDGPLPRDLAVECRFDGNILTGFKWTAGPTR